MQKVLLKSKFKYFISELIKKYEVIAPVNENEEISKFKIIEKPEEIYLDKITLVPVKQFFLPENETLFEFKNNKIEKSKDKKREKKKRVIFGLRKCDLNSLLILDKVMYDSLYIKKRRNTILIGIYCENPDEYCFCNSMDLKDYYDLFFYPYKNKYYISIGSKKGLTLVKNLSEAKEEIRKEIKNTKNLKDKDIERNYKNSIWESDTEKCLSCAACTAYCPTCNCFDIKDRIEIDLKKGKRIRTQSSCQLKNFSEVAGGKIFRESRISRFKHFIYHKIVYFKKKYGKYMCVGCGRCLRVCPTKIDWVETINLLKSHEKIKNDL